METKALFRALLWSFMAFFLWTMIANRIWGPPVQPPATATSQPASAEHPQVDGPTQTAATVGRPSSAPTAGLTLETSGTAKTFTLGSAEGGKESPYRMELELSEQGAAIRSALLSDFAQEVKDKDGSYLLLEPVEIESGKELLSLSLEKLTVDNQEIDLSGVTWEGSKQEHSGSQTVTFTTALNNPDGQPALALSVEYRLQNQPSASNRHDLDLLLSITNRDDNPRSVVASLRGPIGGQRIDQRVDDRAISVANYAEGVVQTTELFNAVSKEGLILFDNGGGQNPYWWTAVSNRFFTCLITPLDSENKEGSDNIAAIEAVDLDGRPETDNDITVRLVSRQRMIAAGETTTFPFSCYLGPLDRVAFAESGNADYVTRNYNLLITRNYSFCTFAWLTEFMLSLLGWLSHIPPYNHGVAIVILVLMVRTLLHPLTKRGQVNMMKMQKQMGSLAPKMEEIKKRLANDKVKQQQETQKLYQTEGINPAGQIFTCLPMFLQMPIWVALYTGLSNNIGMRHEPFCLWIRDLTAPDQLIAFSQSYSIPLLSSIMGPVHALNILPILWAVAMYAQQKMMPKPKPPEGKSSAQTDQAAQMQKMMPFMSIFFALLFYNAPSGLTLYIMASTVFGTVEQFLIRKHIKELEDKGGFERKKSPAPTGPRGPLWLRRIRQGMADRFQEAQRQADQAQQQQRKKK